MPNKRAAGKDAIHIWTDSEIKRKAAEILARKGLTLTDAINEKLIQIIKEEGEKLARNDARATRKKERKEHGRNA